MAEKMDQGRLLKIGYEAFALLEEHDQRKGRPNSAPARQPPRQETKQAACLYKYHPQKPLVYQVNPASATEENMNSYQAMMRHDGLLIMDYSKKKSTAMAY